MAGQTTNPMDAVNKYSNANLAKSYSAFGGDQGGWQNALDNPSGKFGQDMWGDRAQNPFGGLEQIGKGVGIAGDLFGMYNQYQTMKMAKNQMANQAKTSNYNMQNNTDFKNSTAQVFGSNMPTIQNQFATY